MSGVLALSTWWEQLNNWAAPQYAIHIYTKNLVIIKECSSVDTKRSMWLRRPVLHEHRITFRFYHTKKEKEKKRKEKGIIDVHAKFALECHWLESTPSHELLTQQKHDHFLLLLLLLLLSFFFPPTFHSSSNCTAHVSTSRYPCKLDVCSYLNFEWMS